VTPVIPARNALVALGILATALLVALVMGVPAHTGALVATVGLLGILAAGILDYATSIRAWQQAAPRMTRRLPAAFAIGVPRAIELAIEATGDRRWVCRLHDRADGSLKTDGLPIVLDLSGSTRLTATYSATPTRRGEVAFAPADVRVRSRWGFCELLQRLGDQDRRRVYPDFAQVARYAWLASDRRLHEIGVKTYQQRGEGTDFKQLSEYRTGDSVRHIDWRASLRYHKPIVRQFQDERDQCVLLLVDCGRRLRADDRDQAIGTTHFDQVLNAVMLLSHVALTQGDAVGAMTFGTPPADARVVAPRKGRGTLNALMSELYAVQPSATHSDYLDAAQNLLRRFPKRALVIVITNFRDEDGAEARHALRLLRSRHLVMVASLRERVVRELINQPLHSHRAAIEVASAHMYDQERRGAFAALATRDGLMIDAEPDRLGVELVNRYQAVKRAGLM
jgi:uncharacterized protein (DUF58 family)